MSKHEKLDNHVMPQYRVLFVVGFLWGDEGIVIQLETLAKALMKEGWKVAIASSMKDQENRARSVRGPQWFEDSGIKHFFIPFPDWTMSRGKKIVSTFQALLRLNSIVSQFNPNVIHIHSLSVAPYVKVISLYSKIPYVSTAHIEPSMNRFGIKLGAFVNQYYRSFLGNRFIAISTEVKEVSAKRLNIPRKHIRLICHGIDTDYFRPPSNQERLDARSAFKLESEFKVISLIGRLCPIKGQTILIRALAMLKSEGIEAIALLAGVGEPEYQHFIIKQATELGVFDQVQLLGFTDSRQVLWASDICVLPSQLEGFPLVIPEAMSCGIVSIRTPAAGTFDQIEDGVNGFIVPFDDPKTLALRLKQLLENDKLKLQMSAVALKSAGIKFTVDRMTKDTIAVYEELINEN